MEADFIDGRPFLHNAVSSKPHQYGYSSIVSSHKCMHGACYSHTCWIFFLQPSFVFWYITISFIFFLLALTSEQLFESIASPIHAFTHTRAHVHAHTWTCKLISQTSPCKLISPTPATRLSHIPSPHLLAHMIF